MNGSGEGVSGSVPKKLMAWLIIAIGTSIVLAEWLVEALHSPQVGWDFPVFYIAAKLPRQMLYDPAAFESVWRNELVPLGVPHWNLYIRPSAFVPLFRPIALLAYRTALWWWMLGWLFAYLGAVIVLIKELQLSLWFLPAGAAFFPALGGILSGQDNALYLFVFTLAVLLLSRRLDWLSGALLTICFCKFYFLLLIPLSLFAHRRFKALLALTLGVLLCAVASLWSNSYQSYLHLIAHAQQDPAFYPVGLRGFSVAIGQPWCYLPLALLAAACCCWLIVRLPLAQSMAVAVLGSLLISPYVTWYDSTLLVLPLAFVFADQRPIPRWAALATLVAMPLWRHGGGFDGPIGFMHVAVELLLLAYFAHMARLSRRAQPVPLSPVTEAV